MYNKLPNGFRIDDKRTPKNFKKQTFNGYKKTEVFSDFQKSILCGNIEKSILWATELHCSGYLAKIFQTCFDLFIKEINVSNLHLILIFLREFVILDKKLEKYKDNMMESRNDQYLRNHLHNLVCLLTFSHKCKLAKLPKIQSDDFNMKNNKKRMLTENLTDIQEFMKRDDPSIIIIPLSEILLNLKRKNISKSFENCLFWLNWLLVYEKNFHKGYIQCAHRKLGGKYVQEKFRNDFSWLLWDIILSIDNSYYIKQLFNLFRLNFTKGKKKKKN